MKETWLSKLLVFAIVTLETNALKGTAEIRIEESNAFGNFTTSSSIQRIIEMIPKPNSGGINNEIDSIEDQDNDNEDGSTETVSPFIIRRRRQNQGNTTPSSRQNEGGSGRDGESGERQTTHSSRTTERSPSGKTPSTVSNKGAVGSPRSSEKEFSDCADAFQAGNTRSGIYTIQPANSISFNVFCDMKMDGGGWTVFQNRDQYFNEPTDYFFKNWTQYKNGFGFLQKEHWLGNDKLYNLTQQTSYELRIDLWDAQNNHRYAKYGSFYIGNEKMNYQLYVNGYSGTAGDAMAYHNRMYFSTKDKQNDERRKGTRISCAQQFRGAWWYNACLDSGLNGLNLLGRTNESNAGIVWYQWLGPDYSLAATQMKIRPRSF